MAASFLQQRFALSHRVPPKECNNQQLCAAFQQEDTLEDGANCLSRGSMVSLALGDRKPVYPVLLDLAAVLSCLCICTFSQDMKF